MKYVIGLCFLIQVVGCSSEKDPVIDGMHTFYFVEGLTSGSPCTHSPPLHMVQLSFKTESNNILKLTGVNGGDLSGLQLKYGGYDIEDYSCSLQAQGLVFMNQEQGPSDAELYIEWYAADQNFSGYARLSSTTEACVRNFAVSGHIELD